MHLIAQSFTNSFLNFFSISFHFSPKQSFYNPYYNPLSGVLLNSISSLSSLSLLLLRLSLSLRFATTLCAVAHFRQCPQTLWEVRLFSLFLSPSLPSLLLLLCPASSSQSSRRAFIHLCKQWARLFHLLRHEQNKKANATMIQKWQKILQIKKVKRERENEREREGEGNQESAAKRKRKLKILSFLASEWAVNPISSAIFTCQVAVAVAVDVATSTAQLAAQSTSQQASNSIVAGAVASAWHWMAIESGT